MQGLRKRTFWWLALALLAPAAGAVYFEMERRRRVTLQQPVLKPFAEEIVEGPAELAKRYEDPAQFQAFCRKLGEKYFAMNARYKSLQHRRRQRSKQVASDGKVVADEELVEIVDFPGGQERHRILEQIDRLTGKKIAGESDLQKTIAGGKAPFVYPFMPGVAWDDFSYRFAGVEVLDGKPVVKVEYIPNPPFGRKMAGTVWADAETGQPIRYAGRWHRPQAPVDKFEIATRYGPSENGFPQIRRIESDGSGGVLFIQRRYVVAIDLDDYRPPESP